MITITSCKYYDEFLGTGGGNQGSDFMLGSVGSKVTCVVNFYVKVSAENIAVIVSSTDSTIKRTDGGSFVKDGFQSGNSITAVGTGADAGNHVVSTVTDKVLYLSSPLTTETTYTNASIYRTNLLTAGDYFYNLVENTAPDSFVSLIDSETQPRYVASGFTATGTTATYTVASNSKGWVMDGTGFGVSIVGAGISNFRQYFTLTHSFIIGPVALYNQIENLENGIPPAPDYFADRKCLRHLFKITMKISKTDAETPDTITYSKQGNTAWFGEFLNGEPATYSVSDPVYTYNGSSVDEIQYDSNVATNCTFRIFNTTGTFNGSTLVVVHIAYIPFDQNDYTNTNTTYRESFAYDRAIPIVGNPPVSGLNNGTTYKQIDAVTSDVPDPSELWVSVDFKMASALATRIGSKSADDRNYVLFITIQHQDLTQTKDTDMNSIIVDVNSYGKDLDDSTLWGITPNVKYYGPTGNLLGSSVTGAGGDMVYAQAYFSVKNSGSQILHSIGVRTDAVFTGDTGTFVLEEWVADTSGVCLDDGVQEINIVESKGYRLPENHRMNRITVQRYPTLDTATRAGYALAYPFQLRYETWRRLEGADCDFGQATQDWSVISSKSGWSIKQYVTAEVYDPATDHTTEFEQECSISVVPTGSTGSTGTWCVVTTFDDAGTTEQYGDILNYENTTVRATFYGNFSSLPSGTTGYYAMLFLDQNTIGGVNWVYPFSSYEDLRQADDNSPWIGATGTTGTVAIVQVSATEIRATAKLNWQKLQPSINNYNIRAKLDYLT